MTRNVAPLNVAQTAQAHRFTKPRHGQFASAINDIVFFGLIYP
jgi:hypothetical protein